MYDGVPTHGLVHGLRMEEVFWGRWRILLKVVDLLVVALPPPSNQNQADRIMTAWRNLDDAVYVGKKETREERDRKMMEVLMAEVKKDYELTPLDG